MVLRLRSCLLKLTIFAWRSLPHRSVSALTTALKRLLSFVLSHCFERGLRYSWLYLLLALFCFVYLLSCTLSAQTFSAFFHVPAELFRTHTNEATTTTKATTTCCLRKIHDKIGKKLSLAFCVCQTFRQGPLSFGTTSVVRVAGTAITTGKKEIHHLRD